MSKSIIDELTEGLTELANEEVKKVYDAIEKKEILPIIMKPSTVNKKVQEILKTHKMTPEELLAFAGSREVTADEFKVASEIAKEGE